ncbi:MAG TPA: AbgT family transporter [Acidobacteriaceae bacterium]|jgi:hypothetical protein
MTYLPRVQANSSRHADFRAAIDETGDRGRNRARDVSNGRFAAQRRLAADAYFALIVVFAQRYQKDAGVGTVVAMMLPYGFAISIVWILLFFAWELLGLPMDPADRSALGAAVPPKPSD